MGDGGEANYVVTDFSNREGFSVDIKHKENIGKVIDSIFTTYENFILISNFDATELDRT